MGVLPDSMSTTSKRDRLSWSELLAQVKRVASLFGRVVVEGTAGAKLRIAMVTAMSLLGASAQAGTISALNFFVKGIEADVPKVVPYLDFPIQNDVRTLVTLTAVVLALQLVNAMAVYYVAIASRALARAFHVRSAAQTLEAFSRVPYLRPGSTEKSSDLISAIIKYPRILGMTVEQLVSTLQALCYVIGFLVVLFQISVEVSLFTLPVFLVVLPFLYRLSTQAQKAAKSFFGDARRRVTEFTWDRFRASDQTNVHPDLYGASQRQQYSDSEPVREYLDSFDQIRLSQRRSVLITSLFRGFLLCLILGILGSFAVRGSYSWGELLVYVLALWQLANQVQSMTASLVNLNRYQPRLVVYFAVQAALAGDSVDPAAARLEGPLLISSRRRLEGDAGRLEVARGDRIFYLTDAALSRMEFAGVLAPLIAACKEQSEVLRAASFCSGVETCPGLSLSAMVLGSETPSADQRAHLETRIAELGLARELDLLPDGGASFLSEETWSAMGQELRVALWILSLAESASDLLFIDWGMVGSLEKEFAARLLALLDDRIVFLVSADGRTECEWASGFVVCEGQKVVGVGDARWWGTILPYRRQRVASREAAARDLEHDDEDEDM
jgi:ABC-type multidrug transport system fused ATPase/permease subunit